MNNRKDFFGNDIKYGCKSHKIAFNNKLSDVKEVESFKKFNTYSDNQIC